MAGGAGRTISRAPAYWDTSALVPLCVRQSATAKAAALHKVHEIVVWWGTPVEMASARARLLRTKHISPSEYAEARRLAEKLSESWSVIEPSNSLRSLAQQLVVRYDLRAADALQLAAALEWCEGVAQGRTFLTADERLRDAALLAGFEARAI